jgi:hypothetical protein
MNSARIINRVAVVALSPSFEIPKDGKFHLARRGEFPGVVEIDGQDINVIQVIDDQAITSMVKNFEDAKKAGAPDLLVDRDHLSGDPTGETIAEGWISNIEDRSGDLFGEIKLSDIGRTDIEGGNYRFISGEWSVMPIDQKAFTEGCRVRPCVLTGAGLTNRPNIKGLAALSNRERPQSIISDKVARSLRLPKGTTEAEALPVVARLLNRAAGAAAQAAEVATQMADVTDCLITFELEACGIKATDPDYLEFRRGVVANRKAFLPLLLIIRNRNRKDAIAREWAQRVAYANALEVAKRKQPLLFSDSSGPIEWRPTVRNSSRSTPIKAHEVKAFEAHKAEHELKTFREGDLDCAPIPTTATMDSVQKNFLDAVQKYLDQGMTFKDAWLEARAKNPSVYFNYVG